MPLMNNKGRSIAEKASYLTILDRNHKTVTTKKVHYRNVCKMQSDIHHVREKLDYLQIMFNQL